ncbi:MAG: hypothetical protein WBB07_21020 [Mycobacterium sp.]
MSRSHSAEARAVPRRDHATANRPPRPDNRLALLDQAFYEGHRAVGQKEVMQVGWVYDRDVDFAGLERFHRDLNLGLLGRLIERSPLPFGRHRWVSAPQPSEVEIAEYSRPRAELGDWFDECTQLPIDPESGPGWRLSVLPLAEGSTAISLVLSHYVIDGIGGAVAVTEAILGMSRNLDYPPPQSRTRLHALVQDAHETARDAPLAARAFIAAVQEARRRRSAADRSPQSRPITAPTSDPDQPITAPSIWIQIEFDEWSSRAETLGGTNSALAAALTAKLDEHMGRQHGEAGNIPTVLTVNDRTTADDARAVAVSFTRVGIDPAEVTTDLRGTRTAIKTALKAFKETQDEASLLVPLTPFTPKRAWRQLIDYALDDPEKPAVCSNLGDTGPAAIRPDGSLCDAAFARGASQHLTRGWLERTGGQLHVYYGTVQELNKVSIYVCAYHPASVTTKAALGALAARTLAEFGLTGEIA